MTDAPLGPESPFIGLKKVDETGAVRGLEPLRGRDVLLIRVPWLDHDRLDRMAKQAEDQAAGIARALDMDPEKARDLVRGATKGAGEYARATMKAWEGMVTEARVAQEAQEEREAVRDVAIAARAGGADWEVPALHREHHREFGSSELGSSEERRSPGEGPHGPEADRKTWNPGAGGP